MSENVEIIGVEMTTFGRYPDRSASGMHILERVSS
jgi:hypothetical protein